MNESRANAISHATREIDWPNARRIESVAPSERRELCNRMAEMAIPARTPQPRLAHDDHDAASRDRACLSTVQALRACRTCCPRQPTERAGFGTAARWSRRHAIVCNQIHHLDIRICLCHSKPDGPPADQPARRRRTDPPPPVGAGRPRRLLRVGVHRDPRPVAAAPVPPSEAAVRLRPAGPGARGRQCLVRPAARRAGRAGPGTGRAPAGGRPDPGDRPPPGRPRARRTRPRGVRKFPPPGRRLGRDAGAGPPRRRGRGRAARAGARTTTPAGCWTSAPGPAGFWNCWRRGSARASASMPRRRCWRWRARAWHVPG